MFKIFQNKSFWLVICVIILAMLLVRYSAANRTELSYVERLIGNIYVPLQSGVTDFKDWTSELGKGLSSKKTLENQINELQIDNNSLKLENQQLREYRAEAERLEELLAYRDANAKQFDMEAARVIGRSANNWYKIVRIDKGTNDGIQKGMSVVNPDGLVGRIFEADKDSAQVWLVTDNEIAVGVILQDTRDARGIVEGTGDNQTLKMVNIPYYSKVRKGQKVVTSGLSETYPKGILLGTIRSVKREESGLVMSADITPAVDFDKLEDVLVIKSFLPSTENLSEGE